MLNYDRIKDKPRILRSLTGLSQEAFQKLVEPFRQAYQQALVEEDAKRSPLVNGVAGEDEKPL